LLDKGRKTRYGPVMTMTAEIGVGQLADLVKEVQAGHEVILMQGTKPVAKLVSAVEKEAPLNVGLEVRSIKGHRVLTPITSQSEIAEEMFTRK
jgi:antitoxin (DNA-binding transcriptional repressor) of toxin-antitoxin stability system